ncbi:MAG: PASTA domain-containing protein [Candidatus Marinimicrobia bacterium]|nr:PASTA domain-containing protein [Candidatus Neomarinimicrobiota bacterium]
MVLIKETRKPKKKKEKKPIRNLFIFVGIFALACIILALLINFIVMPQLTRKGQERILLDVQGLTLEEARHLLELEKFTPVRGKSIPRDDIEPFKVVAQMPRPGTRVKLGRRVYLDVSIPLENVTFPDLIGKTLRSAKILMEDKNLNVDSVSYGFSDMPREVIFWQSIEPDKSVRPGSGVHVKISLGLSNWEVPTVVNMSFEDAYKTINDAGLRIGTVSYRDRNDLLPNTVIYQSVPGTTVLSIPQPIDLVVSRYNEELEVKE